MNTTLSDKRALVREEPIRRLEPIVFALSSAARGLESGRDEALAALPSVMSAECLRCGLKIPGERLLAMANAPASGEVSPWIRRIRAGSCPREGCESERYRLILHKHPAVDWSKLFSADDAEQGKLEETVLDDRAEPQNGLEGFRRKMIIRGVVLLVVIMALFVFRQVRYGGRIPLIREPEKFRVAPLPERQIEVIPGRNPAQPAFSSTNVQAPLKTGARSRSP